MSQVLCSEQAEGKRGEETRYLEQERRGGLFSQTESLRLNNPTNNVRWRMKISSKKSCAFLADELSRYVSETEKKICRFYLFTRTSTDIKNYSPCSYL